MKKLLLGFLAVGLIFSFSGCGDSEKLQKLESSYVNKKVPFSQYSQIGQPETLKGTNNSQWVAYFPKGDFTIVSDKKTNIVQAIYEGKVEQ
jgi:hypothetical protein